MCLTKLTCDIKSMGMGTLLSMGTLGQQEAKGHAQSDTEAVVEVPRLEKTVWLPNSPLVSVS